MSLRRVGHIFEQSQPSYYTACLTYSFTGQKSNYKGIKGWELSELNRVPQTENAQLSNKIRNWNRHEIAKEKATLPHTEELFILKVYHLKRIYFISWVI